MNYDIVKKIQCSYFYILNNFLVYGTKRYSTNNKDDEDIYKLFFFCMLLNTAIIFLIVSSSLERWFGAKH